MKKKKPKKKKAIKAKSLGIIKVLWPPKTSSNAISIWATWKAGD